MLRKVADLEAAKLKALRMPDANGMTKPRNPKPALFFASDDEEAKTLK